MFNSVTVASRPIDSRGVELLGFVVLGPEIVDFRVKAETSFSRLFNRTIGSSAFAFLSLFPGLLSSSHFGALLKERRIKSSFEDMTSSRWPVDSSVWPPDFLAKS